MEDMTIFEAMQKASAAIVKWYAEPDEPGTCEAAQEAANCLEQHKADFEAWLLSKGDSYTKMAKNTPCVETFTREARRLSHDLPGDPDKPGLFSLWLMTDYWLESWTKRYLSAMQGLTRSETRELQDSARQYLTWLGNGRPLDTLANEAAELAEICRILADSYDNGDTTGAPCLQALRERLATVIQGIDGDNDSWALVTLSRAWRCLDNVLRDTAEAPQAAAEAAKVTAAQHPGDKKRTFRDYIKEDADNKLEQAHKIKRKGAKALREIIGITLGSEVEFTPSFSEFKEEFKGVICRSEYNRIMAEFKPKRKPDKL